MKKGNKLTAIIIALTLIFTLSGVTAFAVEEAPLQSTQEFKDCHQSHDALCGLTPCTHNNHTSNDEEACGYTEGDEASCKHHHNENCGYGTPVQTAPCTHTCEECRVDASQSTEVADFSRGSLSLAEQAQATNVGIQTYGTITGVIGQSADFPFYITDKTQILELSALIKNRETYAGDNKYSTAHYLLLGDVDFGGTFTDSVGTTADPFTGFFNGGGYNLLNVDILNEDTTTYKGLFITNTEANITGLGVTAIKYFAGGIGSESSPYEIDTPSRLANLATLVNSEETHVKYGVKHYKLTADIDMTDYRYHNGGKGVAPIGQRYANKPSLAFLGNFDGNGKVVKNIFMSDGGADYLGLFGFADNCVIKNLGVISADINAKSYIGGLVGYGNNATIENCYTTGTLSATNGYVGGVIGSSVGCTIKNSYSNTQITALVSIAGGITGHASNTTIDGCYSLGNTNGTELVGGITGDMSNGSIQYCYATGIVTADKEKAGGLVGGSYKGEIKNNYYTGMVHITLGGYAGGIIGFADSTHTENCYAKATLYGNKNVGGIAGGIEGGTVQYCYATGSVEGRMGNYFGGIVGNINTGSVKNNIAFANKVDGNADKARIAGANLNGILGENYAWQGTTLGGSTTTSTEPASLNGADVMYTANTLSKQAETVFNSNIDWNFVPNKLPTLKNVGGVQFFEIPDYMGGNLFKGDGLTESTPYEIGTPLQLIKMAELIYTANANYGDKYYKLTADIDLSAYTAGSGFTLIGTSTRSFKGTFDGNGKKVTNLKIDNVYDDAIGLFGYTQGATIKNLGVEGATVKGNKNVGGIVGHAYGTNIKNSYYKGYVLASGDILGGICGASTDGTTIENSYFKGTVSGNISTFVGGITGNIAISGGVKNCYAEGTIIGSSSVGGIVGDINAIATTENCFFTGEISAVSDIGGIVGSTGNNGTIKNNIALGKKLSYTTSTTNRVVGKNTTSTLSNNYAYIGMKLNTNTIDSTDDTSTNGANLSYTSYVLSKQFAEVFGSDTAWEYTPNKLPILVGVGGGQTTDLPPYVTNSYFAGGDGLTEATAFEIATPRQLKNLSDLMLNDYETYNTKYYKLIADIDLAVYKDANNGTGFVPIGTSTNGFKGSFNGNGKEIFNLTINNGSQNLIGLFSYLDGAKIKNLGLKNCDITGNINTGGIAGYSTGASVIENSYVIGNISGNIYVGGISGTNYGGSQILSCYTTGKITGSSSNIGGIVGDNNGSSTVKNCYSLCDIDSLFSGSSIVGGIAGFCEISSLIENCYYTGNVSCGNAKVAGIVGYSDTNSAIKNCVAFGQNIYHLGTDSAARIDGSGYSVSRTNNYAFSGLKINGIALTSTDATSANGADLSYINNTLTKQFAEIFNNDSAWNYKLNELPTLKNAGGTQSNELPLYVSKKYFEGGEGTLSAPYEIATHQQLRNLAIVVNDVTTNLQYRDKHYKLTANIDLSPYTNLNNGEGWTPIGWYDDAIINATFTGSFDGNGKVISNLTINNSDDNMGLFGFANIGQNSIKNLGVVNCKITGGTKTGGLGGNISGNIENCYVTGSIKGVDDVGGLVGNIENSVVKNCYTAGTVWGVSNLGGIGGTSTNTQTQNCYSVVNVGGNGKIGGIYGHQTNNGNVATSYFSGNAIGVSEVGGIVGANDNNCQINNCLALGQSVFGTLNIGRIVGQKNQSTLASNYAYEGMEGGGSAYGKTNADGEGKTLSQLRNIEDEAWAGFKTNTAWVVQSYGYLPVLSGFTQPQPNRRLEDITKEMVEVAVHHNDAPYSNATLESKDLPVFYRYFVTGAEGKTLIEPGTYALKYGDKTITENIKITEQTTLNTYAVDFNTLGGSEVASQLLLKGECATMPPPPTKTGSTFMGWYTQEQGGEEFDFSTPITAHTTLYARWNINIYNVDFDVNGGIRTGGGELFQKVPYGQDATAPIVEYEGHMFAGWDKPFTNITENTSVTANWTVYKEYPVISQFGTFNGSGTRKAVIDAPKEKFLALYYNDVLVAPTDYTVKEGSTAVILTESYLKTFEAGNYNFLAVFSDGYAHLKLTVQLNAPTPSFVPTPENATANTQPSPKTWDGTNLYLWIGLLAVALVALTFGVKRLRN